MTAIFDTFHEAQRTGDGNLLASCLVPVNTKDHATRLRDFADMTNFQHVERDIRHHLLDARHAVKLPQKEANNWVDIFVALWKCCRELSMIERKLQSNWDVAYKSYKEICIALQRGYTNYGLQAWTIPCCPIAGKYLRLIAIRADTHAALGSSNGFGPSNGFSDDNGDGTSSNAKLAETATVLVQMMSVCRTDDSDLTESRKWGVISLANLLFKTYFKLDNLSLTRIVTDSLDSPGTVLPPLSAFPKSHQCTYLYYRGVLDFLKEDYEAAQKRLTAALEMCPQSATKNREQILTYLVPTTILIQQRLPTDRLLAQAPNLRNLLAPVCHAIKTGNLAAFDRALNQAEVELIRKRIYLVVERLRDLCMRTLFRKVFIYAGYEVQKTETDGPEVRRTRLDISEFETATKVAMRNADDHPMVFDRDEVECYLANMIYKGYIKGYIAREQGKIVLSKSGAFPKTGV